MSNNWRYTHGGEEFGPVGPTELKRLAASGGLVPDDKVWREGTESRIPARSIKGLFPEQAAKVRADEPPPLPPKPARTAPPLPPPVRASRDDEEAADEKSATGGRALLFGLLGGGVLAVLLGVVAVVAFWPKGKGDQAAVKHKGKSDDPAPESDGKAKNAGKRADPTSKPLAKVELPTLPIKDGPPIIVTAGRLIDDYTFREKEADDRYKGAIVRVTGRYTNQVGGNPGEFFLDGKRNALGFYLSKEDDRKFLYHEYTMCLEGQCLGLVGKRNEDLPAGILEASLVLRDCKVLLVKDSKGKVVKSTPDGLPPEPKEVQARQLGQDYRDEPRAADLKYKGKLFALSGVIREAHSSQGEVVLEAGTDLQPVRCLFGREYNKRLSEMVKVGTLKAGATLTLQGTCAGLEDSEERAVRLDDCDFVPPSAVKPVPAYLGDEKGFAMSAKQLVGQYKDAPARADRKYRGRIIEVTGVLDNNVNRQRMGLETGTGSRLSVGCFFAVRERPQFAETGRPPQHLRPGQTVTIRGLCGGFGSSDEVRLDNCELVRPGVGLPPKPTPGGVSPPKPTPGGTETLTADYFPHRHDTTLTYDAAAVSGKTVTVIRSQQAHKADGVVETAVVKTGQLAGRDLATGMIRWSKDLNQKSKHPMHHRIKGGFVEIGQHAKGDDEVFWEPVLKIGAKVGDEWSWDAPGSVAKKYTLLKFDKHNGRPAIVVRTVLDNGGSQLISDHTYAKGVGEVERATSLVQGTVSTVVGQIRLVEGK